MVFGVLNQCTRFFDFKWISSESLMDTRTGDANPSGDENNKSYLLLCECIA